MSFDSIPLLDLSFSRRSDTKPSFLRDLRRALIEVGFLYISNTGINDDLIQKIINNGKAFFEIPEAAKLAIQMKNANSFLGIFPIVLADLQWIYDRTAHSLPGYSVLGGEITAKRVDWREQLDLSTEHPMPSDTSPLYHNLRAPNQWPSSELLPEFRPVFERYIREMSRLSTYFTSLVAEALELPATAFDKYFDQDQQHKLKIVRYPDLSELNATGCKGVEDSQEIQGVGPHKDSMLTSYLLQASHHRGLQAQNVGGEWIDVPPKPGTLVVAIGQGLEALTSGVCASTTHRVLVPGRGQGSRFSIPFFQGVSYDAEFESVIIPEDVREQKRAFVEGKGGRRLDDIEFTFVKDRFWNHGEATLFFRCKSHEDVAKKHYPLLWERICEEKKGEGDKKRSGSRESTKERQPQPAVQTLPTGTLTV